MYTYQDLLSVGQDEKAKGEFAKRAIDSFKGSLEYKRAAEGEAYYNKHNLTIENYQKYLYTLSGGKVADVFSADYKLKTLFFHRLVGQQVLYVCGNGVQLTDAKNKEKLGKRFDFQLRTAAKRAMASGRAFGFWNLDHLEVFGYADTPSEAGFCPLYDDQSGELMAGIRFWDKHIEDTCITCYTLYEADGVTEYSKRNADAVIVRQSKKAYKQTIIKTNAGDIEEITDENYSQLPIVPLYANDTHESELVGIRECIDCYDFVKSGLANDIDDTSGFYWILKNTGGMDDVDLAGFIQRMKTVRAAVVDGDDGATAEPHTMEVPTEARRVMLELLRSDIYEDFQSLDVKTLSAAAKTTQEIQAAYQSMDNKCADFEYYLIDFVERIMEIADIDDTPTFLWNRVVNQGEQTSMVLSAANYLTDEMVVKHLPFLTPEEQDIVIKDRTSESYTQFNGEPDDEPDDSTEGEPEE